MHDAELLQEFLNESWDNLEKLDQDFIALEQTPGDRDIITRIFRAVHTIKGCSGFLGFGKIEKVAHYAEDILSQVREGSRTADPAIVSKLLEATDSLKEILRNVEATRENEGDKDYTALIEELRTIAASDKAADVPKAVNQPNPEIKSPQAASTAPVRPGDSKWEISVRIRGEEQMPAIRGLVVIEGLRKLGTVDEVIPDILNDEPLPPDRSFVVFMVSGRSPEELQKAALNAAVESAEVTPAAEVIGAKPATPGEPAPADQSGASQESTSKAAAQDRVETSIRVDVSLVDRLMNLVGELVLSRNQILQLAGSLGNDLLTAAGHRVSLVTSELQENVMKTRMQPIANVFNRFPRMVRDLAADFGKQVELQIEGKETELDRTLIEAIKDPMVHILRNSLDHGIETPSERAKKGKPPAGTLEIRAFHEGGQINIVIRDDGAGVNIQRVKETALKKGLINQQQAADLPEKEVVNLLFMPGFSTAEKVTSVSGRGVGMDVVRTNIEKIGGSVEMHSEAGRGTTLTIKIPLTLAIIPALMVSAAGQRFAIPQVSLVELVSVGRDEIADRIEKVRDVEVYRLRGNLLPLLRLGDALNLPQNGQPEGDLYFVVLSVNNRQFGLIVDDVHDTEEIVVKPLSKHLKQVESYAGATILGDGSVALILDPQGLVSVSGMEISSISADASAKAAVSGRAAGDLRDILLFRLGEEGQFAIPLGLVNRLEEFDRKEIESVSGKEIVQYRGDILPLIRPSHFLNIPDTSESEVVPALVFSFGERQFGLAVDQILDVQEASLEFSRASVTEKGVLGTSIINGKATQFLDVHALLERAIPEWFEEDDEKRFGGGRHALLVDDAPFYRTLGASYLTAAGFDVTEAENGEEALQLLEKSEFDIVLTDLEMPVMDGFEFIRNLRMKPRYQHLPVVVLTTHAGKSYRDRALQAGANGYLVKLERSKLLKTIEHLLLEGRD